jgi:hypothetical protein
MRHWLQKAADAGDEVSRNWLAKHRENEPDTSPIPTARA